MMMGRGKDGLRGAVSASLSGERGGVRPGVEARPRHSGTVRADSSRQESSRANPGQSSRANSGLGARSAEDEDRHRPLKRNQESPAETADDPPRTAPPTI